MADPRRVYRSVGGRGNSQPLQTNGLGSDWPNWKSPLILIDGHVNRYSYCDIFEKYGMAKMMSDYFGEGNYWLQQDNARPHRAKFTLAKFAELKVPLYPIWPARSPDFHQLNKCGHSLKPTLMYPTSDREMILIANWFVLGMKFRWPP